MHIVSVNVAPPRVVTAGGRRIRTGIFKQPVEGPVRLHTLNLDGDRQADLRAHGGPSKAAYVYLADHDAFWRAEFPGMALPWGMFGENFSLPCYKLAAKFGRQDVIPRFLASGRTGFYLAVVREGTAQAGDTVELLERDRHGVTVADITRLYAHDKPNRALLARAVEAPALPEGWKAHFRSRISSGL